MKLSAGLLIETNHDAGPGSIGCFAKDKNDRPVLLTCSHVLFPGFDLIPNMKVHHPSYSSCCSGGPPVATPIFDPKAVAQEVDKTSISVGYYGGVRDGKWYGGFNARFSKISVAGSSLNGHPSLVDCAMATIDEGIEFENVWRVEVDGQMEGIVLKGIGNDGLGVVKGPKLGQAPSAEQYVRVYSQNSKQLKYATLASIPNGEINTDYNDPDDLLFPFGISDSSDKSMGTRPLLYQFVLLPRPTPKPGVSYQQSYHTKERLSFDGGDSGSVIINHKNEIIGMLNRAAPPELFGFDTSRRELSNVHNLGLASPIEGVLEHLEVTIPSSPQGWSGVGTTPAHGKPSIRIANDREQKERERALEELRTGLRRSRRGRIVLGKIGQHRRELRQLLARARSVEGAWKQFQGPAYYGHCAMSLTNRGHRIPRAINGVTPTALGEALLTNLRTHASPPLLRDLERYARDLIPLLARVERLHDVADILAEATA